MHAAARVGIAVAAAGAMGFGAFKLNEHVTNKDEERAAKLDTQVAAKSKAWDAWSGKLEQQFPGHKLDTPADHARFEAFLEANPEPSYLKVEHERYTKITMSFDGPILDEKGLISSTDPIERLMFAGAGALVASGAGVAMLVSGMKSGGSALKAAGLLAGGGAALAYGVGGMAMLVADTRRGEHLDGYHELVDRIEADIA